LSEFCRERPDILPVLLRRLDEETTAARAEWVPATVADREKTVVPTPTSSSEAAELSRSGEAARWIAGYRVLGELGRGGMGVVYKARQDRLKRDVALKMVLSGSHASAEHLMRFLAEAEAVAAPQHPNIVQIFELGTHDGLPFFSLELVEGGTLAQRVREQPLPAAEAASMVERIARGVACAHGRGIIHRDLKPDNVLLTPTGEPKISDFGGWPSG